MAYIPINSYDEFVNKVVDLADLNGVYNHWSSLQLTFPITIPPGPGKVQFQNRELINHRYLLKFVNCIFNEEVNLRTYEKGVWFEDCTFKKSVSLKNRLFTGKMRFHNCTFDENVDFENSKFEELADFWMSKFRRKTNFLRTDFFSTVVFSSVDFNDNVLFTYTLFDNKAIFGRTIFQKGFDLSQSIISGNLQLFDLKFKDIDFETAYVGNNDERFKTLIQNEKIIPLVNKVTTFQILKNQFAKQGNFIDEVAMRKIEKNSYKQLLIKRSVDDDWIENTFADRMILFFNRISNHYKTDFRNGVSFTTLIALFFLILTLSTTKEFWRRICIECEIDWNVFGYGIKQFILFLNPAHSVDYISELSPFYSIPYIFDLFGRIGVSYGIYQTIQAFRKFK